MLCLDGDELAHTGPGPVIVSIGFIPAATTVWTALSMKNHWYFGSFGLLALKPAGFLVLFSPGATVHQWTWTRTSLTPSWSQADAANGPSMLPDSSRRSSSMSVSNPAAARAGAVAASTAAAIVASSNRMRASFIGERPPLRGTRFRSSADATVRPGWP